MWIFVKDAFVSIVEDQHDPEFLWIRARVKGDVSRFLTGQVTEIMSPNADYRYRYRAPRSLVSLALQKHVKDLNYLNFKNEVQADDRHDAYFGVWSEMNRFQTRRARFDAPVVRDRLPPVAPPASTLSKKAKKAASKKVREKNIKVR